MTRWRSRGSRRYGGPAAGAVEHSERSDGWDNKWNDNKRNDRSAVRRCEDYNAGEFLGTTGVGKHYDGEGKGWPVRFACEVCYIVIL